MEAVATSFSNDPSRTLRVDLALCYRVNPDIFSRCIAEVDGSID